MRLQAQRGYASAPDIRRIRAAFGAKAEDKERLILALIDQSDKLVDKRPFSFLRGRKQANGTSWPREANAHFSTEMIDCFLLKRSQIAAWKTAWRVLPVSQGLFDC